MKKLFTIISLVLAVAVNAQETFTLKGNIKDKNNGDPLIGALVTVAEIKGLGDACDIDGNFNIKLKPNKYTLLISMLGYKPKQQIVQLDKDMVVNIKMEENAAVLDEVVVTSTIKNENVTSIQMGVEKLDMEQIKNVPVIFGEKDVIKTLQLLPGVKTAGEGNSGFYVRGGASDQNLILLDEATIYNASHLMGFFSVFNSDAIKDVTLYKGSQPAEYGGRLSSALDIKSKEGNNNKIGVSGGLGIISSRLSIDGPIKKDKGSFLISGRRTYADMFLKLSNDEDINKSTLHFYDVNLNANYRLSDKTRLFATGYYGKDVLGLGKEFGINWGNSAATVRLNHVFNAKLFSNTSAIFSNYDYKIKIVGGNDLVDVISKIQDYSIKQDFQYFNNTKSKIKFGFNSIYHNVVPGVIKLHIDSTDNNIDLTRKYALENAVYVSHEYKVSNKFSIEFGARLASFSLIGPGNIYSYNSNGETIDTTKFTTPRIVKTYFNLQPRISANYMLTDNSSLKAAYARNAQNMHLLSNSSTGNPTDLWIMSSNNIKPELCDQLSLGYFKNFKENMFEFSTEVYYKYLQNQIDYKTGAQLLFNEQVESQVLSGIGRAYGIEFSLKKKFGRFNGWVGYTLSRTERKIEGINDDNWYAAKQDRTHDLSVVGIYDLTKKWNVSATFVFSTGNAVTFPGGKYQVAGQTVSYYPARNSYRMPNYHRLDIGATYQIKKNNRFESSLNISVYNAYGRQNAYSIEFKQDPNDPDKTQAIQTSLFKWVPSITYNFKF